MPIVTRNTLPRGLPSIQRFGARRPLQKLIRLVVVKPIRDGLSSSIPICLMTRMPTDTETLQLLVFFAPLCVLCAALALIDIRRGIIPNGLNLSIAGLGLTKIILAGGVTAGLAAGGEGIAIGLIFWLLRRFYFVVRKTQGLGLGDVKFLAAAGPWIGIAGLPTLLLIATLAALAAAGSLQMAGRDMTRQSSLPFGPFLALGLLLTVVLQQFQGLQDFQGLQQFQSLA